MLMKFNKSSQLLLVSAASLAVAALMSACGTLTVDFVFVTSSKAAGTNNYGEVDVFEIDSESGFMRQIPTSPFPSGGRNPVAEALSPDNASLYVVNQDDSSIVQFIIGNDGKLYPQNTVDTAGTAGAAGGLEYASGLLPLALAASGTNLFVLNTYQPLPTCSSVSPCAGSIGVYPIQPTSSTVVEDTLGAPIANPSTGANYWPLTLPSSPNDVIVPTAINVLKSGADVFVSAYDSTAKTNTGYVFGFAVSSGGVLTAMSGSPYAVGTHPSAIASDSITSGSVTTNYVYVTDQANGNVLGYSISSTGLSALPDNPFPAGDQPSAIVVDPAYPYAYVANAQDSTVTAYSIGAGGALTSLGTDGVGLDPVAIGIDPNLNHFLFVANYLGNSVSGFELSSTDGSLVGSQNSPYAANAQPTAVAAIPHNGAKN